MKTYNNVNEYMNEGVNGLQINFKKVSSSKYVQIMHEQSEKTLTGWIFFRGTQKSIKELVSKHLGLLDWTQTDEQIENNKAYFDNVCKLINEIKP